MKSCDLLAIGFILMNMASCESQ